MKISKYRLWAAVGCSNQPPLDITGLIKPKLNSNVVLAVPNIFTLQDCLRSDH